MVTVLFEKEMHGNRLSVIRLPAGDTFLTRFTADYHEDVASVVRQNDRTVKIRAKTNLIMSVKDLHASSLGGFSVGFIRTERPEGKGLHFAGHYLWPKLSKALQTSCVSRYHALGSFENALIYGDERAVPDPHSRFRGWIIARKDIDDYLRVLPERKETGEEGKVWIIHRYSPEQSFNLEAVYVFDYDPSDEKIEGELVVEVTFDVGSRKVKKIVNKETGEEYDSVTYRIEPHQKIINVGLGLPPID